jgi:hypothetical protein
MIGRVALAAAVVALNLTPAEAHDIYAHLTDRLGRSCCDGSECRPAPYGVSPSGAEMLVDDTWIWVPRGKVQYRNLEGDTGETSGGHWCGEPYDGFITYCAFLPPTLAFRVPSP